MQNCFSNSTRNVSRQSVSKCNGFTRQPHENKPTENKKNKEIKGRDERMLSHAETLECAVYQIRLCAHEPSEKTDED